MSGTMIETLPVENEGSQGLLSIDLATRREEKLLCADPRTVLWCRARDNFYSDGWETRSHLSNAKLLPAAAAMPSLITGLAPDMLLDDPLHPPTFDSAVWNAYNQRHAARFGLGAKNGRMKLANGLSVHGDAWGGDFTVAMVARPGPNGDNVFFWGNDQTAGPSSSGTFLQWAGGGLAFQVNGQLVIPSTANAVPPFTSLFEDGPRFVCVGFCDSQNKAWIEIDDVFFLEVSSISTANSEGTFNFGASGAAGSGTCDGGDVGDVFVSRGYLLNDAPAIARVRALVGGHYGRPTF